MEANREKYKPTSEDDEFRYELKSEGDGEDDTCLNSLSLSAFFTDYASVLFLSLVHRCENERDVVVFLLCVSCCELRIRVRLKEVKIESEWMNSLMVNDLGIYWEGSCNESGKIVDHGQFG